MFHGDRGGICIQHLPPKWRWQLPGRRSSPQISMLLYHLFIYDFLGFPMCFLCVSLFLYVFFPWFSFFSCCFFQVYSQVFPHVFPAPPRPSGRNIPRSQSTPPREVESCSQVRGDTKKWDMYGDFMFFMGYQWTSMEFESGFDGISWCYWDMNGDFMRIWWGSNNWELWNSWDIQYFNPLKNYEFRWFNPQEWDINGMFRGPQLEKNMETPTITGIFYVFFDLNIVKGYSMGFNGKTTRQWHPHRNSLDFPVNLNGIVTGSWWEFEGIDSNGIMGYN